MESQTQRRCAYDARNHSKNRKSKRRFGRRAALMSGTLACFRSSTRSWTYSPVSRSCSDTSWRMRRWTCADTRCWTRKWRGHFILPSARIRCSAAKTGRRTMATSSAAEKWRCWHETRRATGASNRNKNPCPVRSPGRGSL